MFQLNNRPCGCIGILNPPISSSSSSPKARDVFSTVSRSALDDPFPTCSNRPFAISSRCVHLSYLSHSSQETSTSNARLARFVFARFAYTPAETVDTYIAHLPALQLQLPMQMPQLIGHLHGVNEEEMIVDSQVDTSEIDECVERARQFFEENPDWIEQRFFKADHSRDDHVIEGHGKDKRVLVADTKWGPTRSRAGTRAVVAVVA